MTVPQLAQAELLAHAGYGWEDIAARLRLTGEDRDRIRGLVLFAVDVARLPLPSPAKPR